jgi:guanylate kinase
LKRNSNLKFLLSCTTRQEIREEEKERSPYIRMSKEEFENKIKAGEFFEFEEIHGNYYGILKSSITEIKTSNFDFVKDLGVLGHKSIIERLGDKIKIVSIFLDVPKKVLIKRLKLRGEGEQEIEKRMGRFDFEISYRPNYDLIIPNDNLEKTIKIIEGIIKNKEA